MGETLLETSKQERYLGNYHQIAELGGNIHPPSHSAEKQM
jgi:hypothetical protein